MKGRNLPIFPLLQNTEWSAFISGLLVYLNQDLFSSEEVSAAIEASRSTVTLDWCEEILQKHSFVKNQSRWQRLFSLYSAEEWRLTARICRLYPIFTSSGTCSTLAEVTNP